MSATYALFIGSCPYPPSRSLPARLWRKTGCLSHLQHCTPKTNPSSTYQHTHLGSSTPTPLLQQPRARRSWTSLPSAIDSASARPGRRSHHARHITIAAPSLRACLFRRHSRSCLPSLSNRSLAPLSIPSALLCCQHARFVDCFAFTRGHANVLQQCIITIPLHNIAP